MKGLLKTMKSISSSTSIELAKKINMLDIKREDIVAIVSNNNQIHLFYYN